MCDRQVLPLSSDACSKISDSLCLARCLTRTKRFWPTAISTFDDNAPSSLSIIFVLVYISLVLLAARNAKSSSLHINPFLPSTSSSARNGFPRYNASHSPRATPSI